jgi:hypothetical protein
MANRGDRTRGGQILDQGFATHCNIVFRARASDDDAPEAVRNVRNVPSRVSTIDQLMSSNVFGV